ncbi:hypothetical protein PFISCL1PPCAC_7987, partial [Pristionchus fissidentatus]
VMVQVAQDGSVSVICPKFRCTITADNVPRTLDCGHSACTGCARVFRHAGRKQPYARCAVCGHVTRRQADWNPPINQPLLKIITELGKLTVTTRIGKTSCTSCKGFYEEKEMRICQTMKCNSFRQSLCLQCCVHKHEGHAFIKIQNDIHASFRGNHKRVDHSFSDRRVIDARGEQFAVSATYLSAHSPFFSRLFYGSPVAMVTASFPMDIDPATFADLLDMVYPCKDDDLPYIVNGAYTRKCCDHCTQTAADRLRLALKLELTLAIDRLNRVVEEKEKLEVYESLNDQWAALKKYVLPSITSEWDLERLLARDRQKIDWLKPFTRIGSGYGSTTKEVEPKRLVYHMRSDLPDSRVVRVGDASLLVSASILCLFAPRLVDFFYNEANRFKEDLNWTLCDVDTLRSFLDLISGKKPDEIDARLIDFLKSVGADSVIHNYEIV